MPFMPVRDLRLYYERAGSGPKLLYINGTGGDLRRKPNVFDSPMAAHFDILSYDQRGLGQTDRPATPYIMADYAEDANALLDAMGWERCAVMGVSFGGMVAQEFAVRYPQRITQLVLACTSSGGAGGASYPLHDLLAMPLRAKTLHMLAISDTRQDAAWQAAIQPKCRNRLIWRKQRRQLALTNRDVSWAHGYKFWRAKTTTPTTACQASPCPS